MSDKVEASAKPKKEKPAKPAEVIPPCELVADAIIQDLKTWAGFGPIWEKLPPEAKQEIRGVWAGKVQVAIDEERQAFEKALKYALVCIQRRIDDA